MSEIQKSTGIVKWFSGQKGFGFIAPDNEGVDDLFVHQTEIQSDGFRTLREGQRVEFIVSSGEDGRNKAVEVVIHAGGNSSRGGFRGRGRTRGNYEGYGGGYGRGGNRGGGTNAANGVDCYNCGGIGHMARNCYRGSRGIGGRSFGGNGRGGRGGGRGGGGTCYTCGEEGHFARDCPNNNNHS